MSTTTSHRDRLSTSTSDVPGADADSPREIPPRGWFQVVKRAWAEAKADQVPLLAAGVAFYSFLALFPAMIALVSLYGLVADPQQVERQVESFSSALPDDAAQLLTTSLQGIVERPQGALGLGLLVSLALAVYSASGGTGNLITAINTAYDEEETRGFVKRKLLAFGLTIGAVVFVLVALALVAVLPAVLSFVDLGPVVELLIGAARWVLLLVAVALALAVLYRWAPDRDAPKFAWVSTGALVATVLWLVGSFLFSLYVNRFGSYGETYGALAGVVVLLLWLWLTCYIVLLGAEINAEAEGQTAADTTKGEARPMGERDAVKADSAPGASTPKPDSPR